MPKIKELLATEPSVEDKLRWEPGRCANAAHVSSNCYEGRHKGCNQVECRCPCHG